MQRSVSKDLVNWYRVNKRALPWRDTDDPYAILVSEVMLQQTQVVTVLPYYARFISLFPTVEALATASEEDAMAAWAGLGYYRRLRNLQATARYVSAHGWPTNLRNLPGVGSYTAAAVGSIAFGQPVACADGNVRRVVSRFVGRTLSLAESQSVSQEMMGRFSGCEWNQAMMELGALICTPTPNCDKCPISDDCVAHKEGTAFGLPVTKTIQPVSVQHVCVCFIENGQIALRRSLPGEWWQGLLVFPYSSIGPGENAEQVALRLGLHLPKSLGMVQHTVTKHRVTLTAFAGSGSPSGVDWHPISRLAELPLPSPQRRVAKMLERAA